MIVVDASVVGQALIDEERFGDRARERLGNESLTAPALIDLEVLSIFKGATRAGTLDERTARDAIAEFLAMPLTRVPHVALLPRIWQLRHNLSVYDASYVALAEAIGAPLLTADRPIAATPGVRCEVELIG